MTQASATQTVCAHCGTLFLNSTSQQFCCVGCEFVHGLIKAKGLAYYYKLKEQSSPTCPLPAQSSSSNYAYCDDPAFLQKLSSDGIKLRFYVEALNCTACLWLLEKLPTFCADAQYARIDMSSSTIEVRRNPGGSFAEIARTLDRFGYRPHPLSETESSAQLQAQERRHDLMRIGVAGALTGNIMILAVSIYSGAREELASQFYWLSAVLAAPVLTYCAWPFYRSAFNSIKAKHLNLDVPIVIAIFAGIAMSCWSLWTLKERAYFDSLSMLVFLLLSSRLVLKTLQNNQLRSTQLENEILLGSVEKIAPDGSAETVSSLSLCVGDRIKIGLDRTVPVDGRVVAGEGSISAAMLTGESQPLKIHSGDYIEAGSQALSGNWILEVKNLPNQTRLAQILRDTEKSSQEKSNFVRATDHVANWFVSLVLVSALALVVYFWTINPEEGITRALALLIVTCPCVFGMAIPLSMSMAIRSAAKKGIIIKNCDSIERLWNTKTLVFDKTGTLTTGEMEVLKAKFSEEAELECALGLEQNQTHPVARAITKYLKSLQTKAETFDQVLPLASGGVSAEKNGQFYQLKPLPESNLQENKEFIQSDFGFFKNETPLAKFEIGDKLRDEAPRLISWARNQKFGVSLISGDRANVVQSCAKLIGFQTSEVHSEVTPEEKAVIIRSFEKGTLMLGDGVNDAMALATADVGVAVCGSLDVSLRAADIYLTRKNLSLILDLFKISNLTKIAIFRNLVFSATFNVISGALAMAGLMTPLWAAVLMPLSSITVLLSAIWSGNKIGKTSANL